ncbi:N-acetylglutaminylglutamine synthetase [Sedimenticola thiotaurini]|uniref:GNAT family acetyltransferase n=1 Tax=Sedimenticola thiotaurini TaxID=1543721 RepID=A0A0F7JWZ0_9GAMM|nr:N-acetylglutaminylglutamine synthetase [Sedimenticola thiotaurini]AKH19103.1 GNAT family acetyltransferase [Sedimenticola thiotaurini]
MSKSDKRMQSNLNIEQMGSLKHWGAPPSSIADELDKQAAVDCGWGRLIFGQTYRSSRQLADKLRDEGMGRRDVALYSRDPQVVVSQAPQELFIDPSLTYRLNLEQAELTEILADGITIRPLADARDIEQINRIYKARSMVPMRDGFFTYQQEHHELRILLAVERQTGRVVGCVTGVDHFRAFEDPDNGSSLWALAVDPQCEHSGVGEALVIALANAFKSAGRSFMDLSVMHDNEQAIQLYEKLGFFQVPVYCIKTKNAINEQLYIGPKNDEKLNVYAQIIVDEAYRRGVAVEIVDAAGGFFDLSLGGRTVSCRESLTDLTSAVAMSRCDDKAVTRRFLARAGLQVPEQELLEDEQQAIDFLQRHQRIVIKPARGEQGAGVCVDLTEPAEVVSAYALAAGICDRVVGERFMPGDDVRIIVINDQVVAAAVRRPASVVGDGEHRVIELIRKQSRRRAAATQGESVIPLDEETERCVSDAGFAMDQVLPRGERLKVRKTANLHTGGTLQDVTDRLHPVLVEAAIRGAQVLDMPLVGFDFIVPDVTLPEYVIIEANERPGLANHEPQPTAEKLLDMLFPQTALANR